MCPFKEFSLMRGTVDFVLFKCVYLCVFLSSLFI